MKELEKKRAKNLFNKAIKDIPIISHIAPIIKRIETIRYIFKESLRDFLKASNLLLVRNFLGKNIEKLMFIPAEAEKTYALNSRNNVPIATIVRKLRFLSIS